MRLNDFILLTVIFVSAGMAIYFPDLCIPLQSYPLYLMMFLMFLSFSRINFDSLLDTSSGSVERLLLLVSFKLVILPAILYWIANWLIPDFAIPVLLLSGISTGVVAPFIANLLETDVAPVLRMVIATSLIAPFSLPALLKILAGAEVDIPLESMVRLLALVIFVPMVAVILARRFCMDLLDRILVFHFPVSLIIFGTINLAVFSKYSHFFFQSPGVILSCVLLAYGLSAIYYLVGFALVKKGEPKEKLASGISFAIMNNVLVIVFSSHFFGPLSPTLAAVYMFPFFTMIIPVKLLFSRSKCLSEKI
ncbi:MAG: bile acid:sodium symporter [Pseudomonadota bacterium]